MLRMTLYYVILNAVKYLDPILFFNSSVVHPKLHGSLIR